MDLRKVVLILAASAFLASEAHAALYFEQDVHQVEKGISESSVGKTSHDFKRKVYVLGELFVIQIEEDGGLSKEYGFDFEKNLYYEADPKTEYYKLFDLDILSKAFRKMGHATPARDPSRGGIVRDLSKTVLEGRIDYPVGIRLAFFGGKEFNGRQAKLYKFQAGPGTFILNPFGWYMKADIWASTDVPGLSEYKAISTKLKEKAAFYKIKHNQISDLLTVLSALEEFPLRIDLSARRRFGLTTSKETSREVTSLISTSPIEPEKILYLKEGKRFSWDVVYSEGTYFGRDVSLKHGEDVDPRQLLPWFLTPVAFFICTYLWFMRDIAGEDRLSLRKFVLLRFYILFSLLFTLQIAHYVADISFIISPFFELTFIFTAGVVWILWGAFFHLRAVSTHMREAHLRYCPRCRKRIGVFFLVCPECNRSIK